MSGGRLRVRDAIAMGVLQGPAELLPVSSSGHLVLAPWAARSEYCELDPEFRKAFEVALHVGTAAAMLLVLRDEVEVTLGELDLRRAQLVVLTFAPAAAAALTFERAIEQHASKPVVVAWGMVLGGAAMLAADRRQEHRSRSDARAIDGLLLGLGQATALVPGVSRNGATLIAARWRGFRARDANQLSRHAALPVIFAAAGLKGARLARRGLPREARLGFAAGAAASFASSLASAKLIERFERKQRMAPYAVYRIALGLGALALNRRRRRTDDR